MERSIVNPLIAGIILPPFEATNYLGFPGHFLERDVFTQTLILVEGDKGSAELDRDYWIRVTVKSGTRANRYPPAWRPWMLPDYRASHASIAPCNTHLKRVEVEWPRGKLGIDRIRPHQQPHPKYTSCSSISQNIFCVACLSLAFIRKAGIEPRNEQPRARRQAAGRKPEGADAVAL